MIIWIHYYLVLLTVIDYYYLFQMIKNKSKHQNMRETTDFITHQHAVNKRNYSK